MRPRGSGARPGVGRGLRHVARSADLVVLPAIRIPGWLEPGWSRLPDACISSAARMVSRHLSRPLERLLAGHGITLTEFQLMITLRQGPARALELARRLRLDPGPTGRTLARLEARGLVRRPLRWRFAPWILEPEGAMHLELLEPLWVELNLDLHRTLEPHAAGALIRLADRLPGTVPREHQGWSD